MKKVIVIGATSGIGKELAKIFSANSYAVGITGRRGELLEQLKAELKMPVHISEFDVSKTETGMNALQNLIDEMGDVDIIVINSGVGFTNKKLTWRKEKETIDINISGFTAMANVAFKYFKSVGGGHLVGMSSVAAIRGSAHAPAYAASKAFISNYLEGLRCLAFKERLPITVTDLKPGFVDTDMVNSSELFWVASSQKAAKQIYEVIIRKKKHAYITRRWKLIAWLLKCVPSRLYQRFV